MQLTVYAILVTNDLASLQVDKVIRLSPSWLFLQLHTFGLCHPQDAAPGRNGALNDIFH